MLMTLNTKLVVVGMLLQAALLGPGMTGPNITRAAGGVTEVAAASAYGCNWPRVCFYLEYANVLAQQPTAAFQDRTSYWQQLGSRSRNAYMVYNSRNDDGARLLYADGSWRCLRPGTVRSHDRSYPDEQVVAVRIMDDPDCAW
jgi:hypothetical protein